MKQSVTLTPQGFAVNIEDTQAVKPETLAKAACDLFAAATAELAQRSRAEQLAERLTSPGPNGLFK